MVERYRARVSGPLLDRIDLHVEVPALTLRELRSGPGEGTAAIAARVAAAREVRRRDRRRPRQDRRPAGSGASPVMALPFESPQGAALAAPSFSPLTWKRGRFKVVDGPPALREVEGLVSGFFGIFRDESPAGYVYFCLNHLPTGYFLAKLRLRRECKAMAAELAVLDIRWAETDPERVIPGAPDARKADEIRVRYQRRSEWWHWLD